MNKKLTSAEIGILWRRLAGLMDEVAETFVRASFSSVVRESGDMAIALLDSQGQQFVQSSRSVPAFIGTMPRTLAAMLERYPAATLAPGDTMITNDSWIGSGHLNDITMIQPIFNGGSIIGYIGSVFHTVDIGGAPSPHARDCFEEGICIPIQKATIRGVENETLFDFLEHNLREPAETLGDLRAQFAAYDVAAARIRRILEQEGLTDLDSITTEVMRRSEESMRKAIEAVPDGVYTDQLLTDGYEEPFELKIAITVRGDTLTVDYTGSSMQVEKPVNCVMNFTYAYTAYALKCALDPATPSNSGAYRPITVSAPEGSIVHACKPAPVWARHLTGHYLPNLVFGALAPVLSGRVIADSGAPGWSVYFRGLDARRKRRFVQMFFMSGGYGARPASDGPHCLAFPTNISNRPIEAFENAVPLQVLHKELIADTGGMGRFMGGLGQRISFTPVGDEPVTMTIRHERVRFPARGLLGGLDGKPGRDLINGQVIPAKSVQTLRKGDVLTFETPGGGGLLPPASRDDASRRRDVALGYVSEQAVASDHAR